MKLRLLPFVLATTMLARGSEAHAATMREKLHAKILASAPPPPPPKPKSERQAAEAPPILMKPVFVSDSMEKVVQAVTTAIERAKQEHMEEQFGPLKGGTLVKVGPAEIGGWWNPDGGWTFMRLNKTQTYRQAQATQARTRELEDLAKIGTGSRPTGKP